MRSSKDQKLHPFERWSPFVFSLLLSLALILGVGCIVAYNSYTKATEATIRTNETRATLLAKLILEHQRAAIGVLESYADRPELVDSVKKRDFEGSLKELADLAKNNPEMEWPFIANPDSTVWVNYPVDRQALNKDLSDRDWYKGVSREWKPYISSVYKLLVGQKDLAVAVCVPILDEKRKVVGILSTAQSTAFFRKIIGELGLNLDAKITLIDQEGHLIYSNGFPYTKEIISYPKFEFVKRAMKGEKGNVEVREGSDREGIKYVSFAPIEGIGWSIIIEKARSEVLRSETSSFILIGVISVLMYGLVVSFLMHLRERHGQIKGLEKLNEELDSRVRERTADLETLNERLKGEITERKRVEEEIRRQNRIQQAISQIFQKALICDTEEELGRMCLAVVEELTRSKFGFIGELGRDGHLYDIAISDPGWDLCTMYDKTGHRRPPGNFKVQGLYGRVLQDGKSLRTNDPASHPDSIGVPEGHPPLRAFLGVPLIQGGKTIGMVAVGNRGGGYAEEHQQDLEAVAPAILQAHLRKRAEETLRRNELRSELLAETAGRLLASENPQSIVEQICRQVMVYLDCHAFFNFLVDEEVGRLHLNACTGIPEEEARRIEWLDYGVAVCGCVARDRARIIAADIFHTPDPRTELVKGYGIQAYCCHPLMARGHLIGTLSFGTKTRPDFIPEEVELMRSVADQVALAMDRIKLIHDIRRSRDELEIRVQERTAELKKASELSQLLSQELLIAQEKERKRISYDLHDNIWQTLEIIKSQIEHLFSGQDEQDRETFRQKSKQLLSLIRDTVAKIRSMQGDLWPSVLDDIGVLATLEWYCREFRANHPGLSIERHVDMREDELSGPVKLVIYRVMQEALTNVAKHSQANRVSLSLIKRNQRVEFRIADNGVGFDPEESIVKRSPWGGLGLLSMKERTEHSGGRFGVESGRDKGTIIHVSWPVYGSG